MMVMLMVVLQALAYSKTPTHKRIVEAISRTDRKKEHGQDV
jgi:hypothetical protein